jgi:hypothetical protein
VETINNFTSFIKLIPRHIIWGAIVSEFVFLNSFSVCFLLVYREVTDFCLMILYPATLLKMFMMSKSVLMEF